MNRFNYILLTVMLILAIGLAACGQSTQTTTSPTESTTTASQETLKIGFLSTMSGPAVMYGVPLWNLAQMQRDAINAAGGIKAGNKTYKLELALEDDKFTPEAGIAAVNKLVFQDKVKIMITGFTVAANAAANPILTENNVLSLSLAPATHMGADTPWFFMLTDNDLFRIGAVARAAAKEKPELKRAVTLLTDDEGGHTWAADFKNKIVPQYTSWQVVDEISYSRGEKEYGSLLAKAMLSKPDVIYASGSSHGEFGLIVKQSRELGYKGILLFSGAMDESVLIPVSGKENAWDCYVPAYDMAITPQFVELLEQYKAKYGDANAVIPFACDVLPVLKQAIEQAGTIDQYKIREVMEKGSFTSLLGPAKFSGTKTFGINHQFFRPLSAGKFENGVLKVVYSVPTDELLKLAGE